MEEMILGGVGAVMAVVGAFILIKTQLFRKNGVKISGEVVVAEQDSKKRYYHTLKYVVDGKEFSAKDRTGYSERIADGTVKEILCDAKNPEKFRYTEEIPGIMIAGACLIVIGIACILRFWIA